MSAVSAEPPNAERSSVELDVPGDAERCGHRARGLELARVTLAVADGQRVQLEAVAPRDRRGGVGIEPAAQQNDGARGTQTPRVSGDQMYLCACSCSRTGSRSARIHSASSRASSTPCTGENRHGAPRVRRAARARRRRARTRSPRDP